MQNELSERLLDFAAEIVNKSIVAAKRNNFAICILIFSFFIEVGVYETFPTLTNISTQIPEPLLSQGQALSGTGFHR